jgi:hypothetical protein
LLYILKGGNIAMKKLIAMLVIMCVSATLMMGLAACTTNVVEENTSIDVEETTEATESVTGEVDTTESETETETDEDQEAEVFDETTSEEDILGETSTETGI